MEHAYWKQMIEIEENGIFPLDFNENFDFCQFSGITFYHNKCNIRQVKNAKFY